VGVFETAACFVVAEIEEVRAESAPLVAHCCRGESMRTLSCSVGGLAGFVALSSLSAGCGDDGAANGAAAGSGASAGKSSAGVSAGAGAGGKGAVVGHPKPSAGGTAMAPPVTVNNPLTNPAEGPAAGTPTGLPPNLRSPRHTHRRRGFDDRRVSKAPGTHAPRSPLQSPTTADARARPLLHEGGVSASSGLHV
jgi:hypothetical protein